MAHGVFVLPITTKSISQFTKSTRTKKVNFYSLW